MNNCTCKDCKHYVTDYDLLHDWCNLEDGDKEIGDVRIICEHFVRENEVVK